MSKTSEIKITVKLDEEQMPEKIEWEANDAGFKGKKESKTLMLSLWDKDDGVTLSIDLWTRELLINDMNIHYYQIFKKMADTYNKATSNEEAAKMIEDFAEQFGNKVEITRR